MIILPGVTASKFPDPAPADPFASDTVFLMFIDSAAASGSRYSDAANSLTRFGGEPSIETADPIDGSSVSMSAGTALRFEGDNAKGVNFSFTDTADISVNLDFTVELWMRTLAGYGTGDGLISSSNSGDRRWLFFLRSATQLDVFGDTNNLILRNDSSTTGVNITDGLDHHIAWTRSGTTNTLWVDGTSVDTHNDGGHNYSNGSSSEQNLYIGADAESLLVRTWANGLLDGVRITHAARYTSAFTPPTLPLPTP